MIDPIQCTCSCVQESVATLKIQLKHEQHQVADLQQDLIALRQQHTAVLSRLQALQAQYEEATGQVPP